MIIRNLFSTMAQLVLLACLMSVNVHAQSLNEIEIRDFPNQPEALTVPLGTKVIWVNDDTEDHTVTSDDGIFHSGYLAPGEQFSYLFDRPGNYPYHCEIHSSEQGMIQVTSEPYTSLFTASSANPSAASADIPSYQEPSYKQQDYQESGYKQQDYHGTSYKQQSYQEPNYKQQSYQGTSYEQQGYQKSSYQPQLVSPVKGPSAEYNSFWEKSAVKIDSSGRLTYKGLQGNEYNLQPSNTNIMTRGLSYNGVSYILVANPSSVSNTVLVNPQISNWNMPNVQVMYGNLMAAKIENMLQITAPAYQSGLIIIQPTVQPTTHPQRIQKKRYSFTIGPKPPSSFKAGLKPGYSSTGGLKQPYSFNAGPKQPYSFRIGY